MSFLEDQTGKIKRTTSKHAISLAMEGHWREAVEVNLSIIEKFPNDIDAHNRLGKAYLEMGEYAQAKATYQKALKLDQYNTIAKKNIQRLDLMGEGAAAPNSNTEKADPNLFIEEIGKAGVVNLYQIAPGERLVKMMAGDKVFLKPQHASLAVENIREEYLGLVPSKFALRLMKLMEGGNKYTCAVVASNETAISVIIRETYQDPSQAGRVSFPAKGGETGFRSYIKDSVLKYDLDDEEDAGDEPDFPGEPDTTGEESSDDAEQFDDDGGHNGGEDKR
jgi:tetratricopeptide (TPR) repeat protein